jgi:6-phosphogluconate dehydrogenase
MGMGISGGEMGARIGPSIMPGGDAEAYEYLKPILESIAAKAKGKPCVAYMGKGAAGHYVKMVHNGIEYALMQMISEVYDFLKRGMGFSNEELHQVFAQWNKGPLQSFLIDITSEIFNVADTETGEQLIDKILDKGGAKGTGKWTSQEAMDLSVPLSVTDAAVAMRNLSVYKDQRVQASKLYTHRRVVSNTEKSELTVTAEKGLYAGFIISYAQGFHLLSKASDDLAMNIPLKDVVQVWKSGCIIRAEMLQLFTAAWERDPSLRHLLLDEKMAVVVQENIPSLRQLIMEGVQNRIPMSALSNALSYFDAFTSDRLPMNLVQAQRDYFGAHTYQRIDKEGVFHTVWNADLE